jgi:hypothetical protein
MRWKKFLHFRFCKDIRRLTKSLRVPALDLYQDFYFLEQHSLHRAIRHTRKPATGEGMDKSTLAHTQIQIIIIHFLPSPIPPMPNGYLVLY